MKTDHVEYMMGHKVDTYDDAQSLGVEFLRSKYTESGVSIRPPTQISKLDMLKVYPRGIGLDPEKILSREALAEPHRLVVGPADLEAARERALSMGIKRDLIESIRKQETVESHA